MRVIGWRHKMEVGKVYRDMLMDTTDGSITVTFMCMKEASHEEYLQFKKDNNEATPPYYDVISDKAYYYWASFD